jgi:hypothetical protein
MSEIKRINESEKYNTTVGWLDDFLKKMAKDLPPSPIGQTTASKEKFATIEEKMNDIKSRVGFASVDSIKKESSYEIVTASEEKCKCGNLKSKCTCKKNKSKKVDERKLKLVKNLLRYIKEMIASEPHLLEPEILSRCSADSELQFDNIGINSSALSDFISKNKPKSGEVEVVYIKPDINSSVMGDVADYYQHGLPNQF